MTEQSLFRFSPVKWALLGALALAACDDGSQVILPGEREGLRDVLQEPDPVVIIENESRAIALGPTVSNAEWAQFWGTPAGATAHPAFASAPQLAWSSKIGEGDGRKQRISSDPVVGDGRIYTLDAAARVTATSLSGQTIWARDLTPAVDDSDEATGGGLAFADGRVYVTLGFGTLTSLDASDGSVVWTQDLEATGSGAPTVRGGLVYLVSGDNTGWAIEADTGRVRWQIGSAEDVSNILGAPAPAVTDSLAIFAFGNGDVQAVFRQGGGRRWDSAVVGQRLGFALSTIGDVTGGPVVRGDNVFVGNLSGRTVALCAGSGARLWTAREGAVGPVWPAGDSVFMVSDRNELLRLSAQDGSRIWGVELPNFVKDRPRQRAEVFAHYGPVIAGRRIVLVSSDGQMRSYDPMDGTLISTVEIPAGAASAPAVANGTLYVLNTRGELLAYR